MPSFDVKAIKSSKIVLMVMVVDQAMPKNPTREDQRKPLGEEEAVVGEGVARQSVEGGERKSQLLLLLMTSEGLFMFITTISIYILEQ